MGVVIEMRRPAPEPVDQRQAQIDAWRETINVVECRKDKIAELRAGATFRDIAANTWTLAGCRMCQLCSDLSGSPLGGGRH